MSTFILQLQPHLWLGGIVFRRRKRAIGDRPYDFDGTYSMGVGADAHCQVHIVYKMFGDMVYTSYTVICDKFFWIQTVLLLD